MLTLVRDVDGIRYSTSVLPAVGFFVAALLVMASGALLLRRRLPGQFGLQLLFGGLALFVASAWVFGWSVFGTRWNLRNHSLPLDGQRVFAVVSLLDMVCRTFAVVLAVGAPVVVLTGGRRMLGGVWLPALLGALGGADAVLVHHHVDRNLYDRLYGIEMDAPTMIHVGQTRDFPARDLHPSLVDDKGAVSIPGWTLEPREIHIDFSPTPSRRRIPVRAHHGVVDVERVFEVGVVEDRADRWLLLEPGNRWEFTTAINCPYHTPSHGPFAFEVRAPEDRLGLHVHELERLNRKGESVGSLFLFGADGETWWLEKPNVLRRAIERKGSSRCVLNFADAVVGQCRDADPAVGLELGGPASWTSYHYCSFLSYGTQDFWLVQSRRGGGTTAVERPSPPAVVR